MKEAPHFNEERQKAIKEGRDTGPMTYEQEQFSDQRERTIRSLINELGLTEESIKNAQVLSSTSDSLGIAEVVVGGHKIKSYKYERKTYLDGNKVIDLKEEERLRDIAFLITYLFSLNDVMG
ncbi:hypothetical protein HZA26_02485 [Candidatus Nomurabacteria bacterium]|nr:hypothetical protein [Candidatus Nomurabacteria bacterium]